MAYRSHAARRWLVRTMDKNFSEQMSAQKSILKRLTAMGFPNTLAGDILVLTKVPRQ